MSDTRPNGDAERDLAAIGVTPGAKGAEYPAPPRDAGGFRESGAAAAVLLTRGEGAWPNLAMFLRRVAGDSPGANGTPPIPADSGGECGRAPRAAPPSAGPFASSARNLAFSACMA